MANINTKLGGTDASDGDVLNAADLNDTFDVLAAKPLTLSEFQAGTTDGVSTHERINDNSTASYVSLDASGEYLSIDWTNPRRIFRFYYYANSSASGTFKVQAYLQGAWTDVSNVITNDTASSWILEAIAPVITTKIKILWVSGTVEFKEARVNFSA